MATPRKTLEAWKASDFVPSAETVAHLRERAKFVRLETIRLIEIAKIANHRFDKLVANANPIASSHLVQLQERFA